MHECAETMQTLAQTRCAAAQLQARGKIKFL